MKTDHVSHVLLVSPLPPPMGGIATWTETVVKHGLAENIKITVVNTSIRGNRQVFSTARLNLSEFSRTTTILISLIIRLSRRNIDVVHINSSLSITGIFREILCGALARLFGTRLITQYHGNIPNFPKTKFHAIPYIVLQHLMKISDRCIVINKYSYDYCRKLLPAAYHKKLLLLPNFVEDDIFQFTNSYDNDKDRLRVLYAGGLTAAKGTVEILEIARKFPNVDFVLLGHELPDIKPYLTKIPKNIHLLGSLHKSRVIEELTKGDIFLFPSHSEGFPMAVLEAMAIGLPVIATKTGALPEMLSHTENLLLVDINNPDQLATALSYLISNASIRESVGRNNRTKAYDSYRYSIVSNALTDIYLNKAC